MSQTVADIAVSLRADVSPFERGMRRANRSLSGFQRSTGGMTVALARVGTAAAAAAAAVAAAGVAMGRSAASAASEISELARISGTTPGQFQRMAAAADTVRISQEKLADIFRDVQDRVGDFIQTGGGPMADFFENIAPLVGVTADQFARLSGPEALQLYVNSLERAGVAQSDMVFYMEAMASDASDLLPLLRNNGTAMRELGDEAARTGRVMSDEAIANGRELDLVLRQLADTFRTTVGEAILENSDDIIQLAQDLGEVLPVAIDGAVAALNLLLAPIRAIGEAVGAVAQQIENTFAAYERGTQGSRSRRDGRDGIIGGGGGTDDFGAGGGGDFLGGGLFPLEGVTFAGGGGTSGGGGGGGGGRDWRAEFEAMQQQFATQQELIQENYNRQLEMLAEFRANRVGTEEEYNELEARINAEHQEAMRQQEQEAMRARLAIVSGAMGDLASIIESSGSRNLEAVRGLRTAEAVIEGYSAAVAAWGQGMKAGGPGLATAYTAASLARTTALISQIRSSGKGGGGGGGSSGSVSTGAAATTSTNVAIQLTGGELYSRDQVASLIDMINEAQADGKTVLRLV